jgi:eukaryotic-like serine/threonine-protein kinase
MKKLPFWLNIIIVLLLGFLMVIGLIFFLDTYTRHGKETEVPNVAQKNLKEALKLLKDKGFDVEVDSTYRDSLPPLYVIKQFPDGGQKVKAGRTIQLIVNKAVPPVVAMPALMGVSVSSALQYLERSNLKLGDTIFKPDFAVGKILKQQVNGKDIAPGTLLPFGTKVTLVIGSGTGSIVYNYPDFYGMTLRQALRMLDTLGLSVGAIVVDKGTKDSLGALIYKQSPPHIDPYTRTTSLIKQGNVVEFWVSSIPKARVVDTIAGLIEGDALDSLKNMDKDNKSLEEDPDNSGRVNTRRSRRSQAPKPPPQAQVPKPVTTPATNKGNDY